MKNEYIKYKIDKIYLECIKNLNYIEYKSNIEEKFPDLSKDFWLKFSEFNVFIWRNWWGKTTILELIDAINNKERVKGLKRENISRNSISRFIINDYEFMFLLFDDAYRMVHKWTLDMFYSYKWILEKAKIWGKEINMKIPIIDFSYEYINKSYKDDKLTSDMVYDIFEKYKSFFNDDIFTDLYYTEGVTCFENDRLAYGKDKVKIHLKSEIDFQDDGSPYVWNIIDIKDLPSWWKQVIWILKKINDMDRGSILLIDEPELHLNSKFQKLLIEEIYKLSKEKDLQVFIATHSSCFIDILLSKNDVSLFNCDSKNITKEEVPIKLLDNLWIKWSDVLQSNWVIWVEWPSDRIYIKNWIRLYCKEKNISEPIENIHYSFQLYWWVNLSHYSFDDNNLISMSKLNRNWIVVIDSDLHYFDSVQNNPRNWITKEKIKKEFTKYNQIVWITQFYTIENYLPNSWKINNLKIKTKKWKELKYNEKKYKSDKNNRIIIENKVEKAFSFFQNIDTFSKSYDKKTDLENQIKIIIEEIKKWWKI